MVQRKDPNKLGIQDHRINSEIRFANLKPSSLQYQDIKINKGVDLKKKMKKSGSTKRNEFENYRSPKLPNYMKSTSSSVARKEQSLVSTTTSPQTKHHVTSDLHGKNLNKATKTLVRTNTLKMKRTLIKTPGFKPGRTLVKKCSKVVLCDDFDIDRATCSSTLKDYKLPDYLALNPGGTESEGTSMIKVCPYTYCSLNGHLHHDPLPPLKSFVSAKRLLLKSPTRVKSAGDNAKSDEKHVNDSILRVSTVCPLDLEEPREFFVEIYTAGERITSNEDIMLPMVCGRAEVIAQDNEEVEEAVSDGDGINFHEILDEDRGEEGSVDMFLEAKIPEEISLPTSFQEETKLGNLSFWNDIATESTPSIQPYEEKSSDMDWETGDYSALYLALDYESPSEGEKRDDLDGFQDENGIISFFDANDMSQYTYSEDGLDSDSVSSEVDCTSEVSVHCLDGSNNMKISAAIEFPKEDQPEAIYEIKDLSSEDIKTPEKIAHVVSAKEEPSNLMIEEETSFGCLNFECLPNEDYTAATGKGEAELLKDVVQEMVTSADKATGDTIIDVDASVQTSSSEDLGIPVEENIEPSSLIVHQTKNDSSESPIKPDQAASPSKVGRGILKKCLEDQLTGERIVITITKCERSVEENDEDGLFNPREPNFLPLEPDPEAEKVDLRHQELDEKKNAEEWMVDYALRQTVTKLGPARKKRVALLVEAFEKVMPITKCELNQSHGSGFDHARPVQACN